MFRTKSLAVLLILIAFSFFSLANATGSDPGPDLATSTTDEIRAAVKRALPLLEEASAGTADQRKCFTCHGQALPVLAFVEAAARGFTVDAKNLQLQLEHTYSHLRRGRTEYEAGKGQGGRVDTAGYALWALEDGGRSADGVTDAVVGYILSEQDKRGLWKRTSNRPPSEASSFTTTYLALRAVHYFSNESQADLVAEATAKAADWLIENNAEDTEDTVFRLLSADYAELPVKLVSSSISDLKQAQRADGGWAQAPKLDSDAYATGSVLYALHRSGLPTDDPSWQRGLRFLLDSQLADGSWHVVSRSKPFQTYFETGFPHGTDQFISTSATAWATLALLFAVPEPAQAPSKNIAKNADATQYSLILRNGKIVDGTGNPWFLGDVAILDDRIAAIGSFEGTAEREIDASSLVIAPGFIDMHSHSDWTLFEDGDAQSKIRQGVTTEILGEGSSGAPNLAKMPPKTVEIGEETRSIKTLDDYFQALEAATTSVNVATYVGINNLWQSVMGYSFDRPSPEQIADMKRLLADAMEDGAYGLSTQVMTPPGSLATTGDLVELCSVVHEYGGIYSTHIRNEGTGVFDSVAEAIAIGERSRVPVDVIHLKIADEQSWGNMRGVIELFESARRRGVNVQANVYPYTRGNNNLSSIIPPWAHEGGREKLLERLRSKAERQKLKRDIEKGIAGWYNHYTAVGRDWSRMLISAESPYRGMTMDTVINKRSAGIDPPPDPLDVLFDLLIEENGSVSTVYAHHEERDMNLAMTQSWCSIGSDGSALAISGPLKRGNPHPRNFGTFPRVLGRYVRERGLLSLEEAVRKLTSLNAAKLGIYDRGILRPGMVADVTIFDANTVNDRATYTDPFHYNDGIEYVIVNGVIVLDNGEHTGARPGRPLRKSNGRSK